MTPSPSRPAWRAAWCVTASLLVAAPLQSRAASAAPVAAENGMVVTAQRGWASTC
jgi:hypothetical protein